MVPLAPILVLFTISSSTVFSEVLEIRTIKASREISTTIRNNLDEGTLPDDRFEAGYSKLVSDRKIEELSRFLKNDMTSGSRVTLATTAKDRWQSSVEIEPNFNQTCCQMWCIVSTMPPGGKDPYQSPAISFNTSSTLPFNRWQVLGGMTFGADEILTLIKIGKSDAEAFPADVPLLTFEGYLFLMDEIRSDEIARLPTDKLDKHLSKALSGHTPIDYFRYPTQSSRMASILKSGDSNLQSNAGIPGEKTILQSESEAALSPDAKWAHVRILAEVGHSGQRGADYSLPFEDTIRVGRWHAVPAGRHPAGSSAVMLIRVSDLHSIGNNPAPTTKIKPLPANGTVTRIYPGIHPSAWKKLSPQPPDPGKPRLPIKMLLIASGIPDGTWSAVLTNNGLLIGNADVAIHQKVETLLVDFTWEKEIAKKTAQTPR